MPSQLSIHTQLFREGLKRSLEEICEQMARRPGNTADGFRGEVVEKLKAGLGCTKKPSSFELTLQVNWNAPSTLWNMEVAASCCEFAFLLQQQGGWSGLIGRWDGAKYRIQNAVNQSFFISKNGSVNVWTFIESKSLLQDLSIAVHGCYPSNPT